MTIVFGLAMGERVVYVRVMRLPSPPPITPALTDAVDDALAVLSQAQLVACLRMVLAAIPESERREMQSTILAFTARNVPTWRPALTRDDELIAEIDVFLKETRRRTGEPAVLASLMMRADQAFLAEEYPRVRAAYERLLPRIMPRGFRSRRIISRSRHISSARATWWRST